ncbi:MAG TPA: DedA family protein [Solirubrobacteraceae bacterium]|jgi:undecaprenyl-diphosphatase|nr:DedA family protein [Solirubrobacteraceae bacterium]
MHLTPLILAALVAALAVHRRRRLPAVVLIAAAAAVAVLLAWGAGLVAPPDLQGIIRDVIGTLGPYTYVLVGALAFLETGAGIGLIAPGETAVIFGGVSAGQGEVDLVALIALVWACALAGDLLSYVLGRRLGPKLLVRHGPALGLTAERLARVEGLFATHGGKTILIGRFIGLVRAVSPFVAGASHMPARRFIPLTTIASGAWAATFCTLGFLFWHSLDELLVITEKGSLALVGLLALAAGLVAWRDRRRADVSPTSGDATA